MLKIRGGVAAVALAISAAPPAVAEETALPRHAVTAYGGWLTGNKWKELATLDDVRLRDAYMLGVGYARELLRWRHAALEVETLVVRHFGAQAHWEADAALMARWRNFPWNGTLPTSFALGIGPSLASKVPAEEVAMDGESAKVLLYWNAEVEVGLPGRAWSLVARLHHRSNAYGVVADHGGSNILTLGWRHRF